MSDLDSNSEVTDTQPAAEVHPVEFPNVVAGNDSSGTAVSLQRFYDVNVAITVELGRVTLPIGELVKLGDGAVLELERAISDPVDVVAQGVRVARGEVVVVDDRYAVRITEIEDVESGAVDNLSLIHI